MLVPFLDLKSQNDSVQKEISSSLDAVFDQSAFAGGPFVEKFEREFAEFCGSPHMIGVSSGTAALWIALKCLGVGDGDEVLTVPNSFIATAEAISLCGAVPVFVDVDENTYTMDPALVEQAITPRTRAVVPVHLYGRTADMDPILEIARKHDLIVVEDAAQAHGAEYKGRRAGSMGHAGCFSFYPGKNLGACGEAGAIATADPELADRMKAFRDHGQTQKYFHKTVGWNTRMDGIQGAILSVKLKRLEDWNSKRRTNARAYASLLREVYGVVPPAEAPYSEHVFHLYVARVGDRDGLVRSLREAGIACGIHYPVPIHRQEAYAHLGLPEGTFPVTEGYVREILSLPMYPELRFDQIEYVVDKVKAFTESAALV